MNSKLTKQQASASMKGFYPNLYLIFFLVTISSLAINLIIFPIPFLPFFISTFLGSFLSLIPLFAVKTIFDFGRKANFSDCIPSFTQYWKILVINILIGFISGFFITFGLAPSIGFLFFSILGTAHNLTIVLVIILFILLVLLLITLGSSYINNLVVLITFFILDDGNIPVFTAFTKGIKLFFNNFRYFTNLSFYAFALFLTLFFTFGLSLFFVYPRLMSIYYQTYLDLTSQNKDIFNKNTSSNNNFGDYNYNENNFSNDNSKKTFDDDNNFL